jgi:hypothetical protein
MSNTKSVEQQLKEAIEASKQTLALSEQVTSLASEKESLSKRLAEIESALSSPKASEPVAVDPLIVAKLGELLAEREMTAKVIKDMQATMVRLEKEAAKKADLNKYVERQLEEGEEGNSPAEKQHLDAGKKKAKKGEMPQFIKDKIEEREEEEAEAGEYGLGRPSQMPKPPKGEMPQFIKDKIEEREEDEACDTKGKHGKKAEGIRYKDHPSPGMRPPKEGYEESELSEDEMEMLREYRNASKAKSKKADSNLKHPLKEETKDFGDIIPQPGLDPNKNNVNEDNTTSPSLNKKLAAKAGKGKAETDVEEIMESTDMQKKEDAEGGEENEVHEKTLSKPGKGAKKCEDDSLQPEAKHAGEDEIPAPLMEYLKQLVHQEKQKKETAKKGENSIGGVNKQDVTGQPDQDEEESFLKKKEGKKAKDNCADTKVHEDGCAPTKGNTTECGDKSPLAKEEAPFVAVAKQSMDSVVDVAVARLAEVAKAKQAVEAELAKQGVTLASETKAKDEAMTAVAQLQAKFESMMAKFAQSEATDKSLEAKAAKIVAQSASEPVTAEMQSDAPVTDSDILAKFEAITDARDKNRYFKANASQISRAVQANLKRKVRS